MLIGNPDRVAFLIERIPEWEESNWKNGLLFFLIKGQLFPKEVRTTTLNCEFPAFLGEEHSPLLHPIVDLELYTLADELLFRQIAQRTYPSDVNTDNDYSFSVELHEINDAGFAVFILSNEKSVKFLIGQCMEESYQLIDTVEIPVVEHKQIILGLKQYYNNDLV